jgi:hypothetical protein
MRHALIAMLIGVVVLVVLSAVNRRLHRPPIATPSASTAPVPSVAASQPKEFFKPETQGRWNGANSHGATVFRFVEASTSRPATSTGN